MVLIRDERIALATLRVFKIMNQGTESLGVKVVEIWIAHPGKLTTSSYAGLRDR